MTYKVSIITPSVRPHMLQKCIEGFLAQDYEGEKEMIIVSDTSVKINIEGDGTKILSLQNNGQIADKLNLACRASLGKIILRMDDDDHYAPDWIRKSVKHLVESKADITGLSSAYFYQPDKAVYDYKYKGQQPYVLGATMCFWRKTWEKSKKKFYAIDPKGIGEDKWFCINNGRVTPHDYKEGFLAMLHGGNISSGVVKSKNYATKTDIGIAHKILANGKE